jgi:WS/DGAT/MGAT family acyltransferase
MSQSKRIKSGPMSSVDAAWLHMDTPTNLAVITGVMIFDGVLDFAWLQKIVERRLLIHDRFCQRVRETRLGIGTPHWEIDPDFDLQSHLHRMALPEPADQGALQEFVAEIMSQPLDPRMPMWHFYVLDNYCSGWALVARLHHCVGDGMSLMQLLLSITDDQPDAPLPEPQVDDHGDAAWLSRLAYRALGTVDALEKSYRQASEMAHEGVELVTNPRKLADLANMGASGFMALNKLLLLPPDRRTIFRGQCGVGKTAVWSRPVDLEMIKGIGRAMGGTVNDVLIAAVTAALRRYLEEREQRVDRLDIRAIVPVNLRPMDELSELGNGFGLVFLSLPIGVEDPLKRLVVLRRRMNAIKNTPEAVVAMGILGSMGYTPIQIQKLIVSIFGSKGTLVLTNVPGPRQRLYMAGSPMRSLMFWVPAPGNLGMGVSIISYAGEVVLGVATDACLVPDPEAILDHFYAELEFLHSWGHSPLQDQVEPIEDVNLEPAPEAVSENGMCAALTRSGQPCKNRARPGLSTCYAHRAVEPAAQP